MYCRMKVMVGMFLLALAGCAGVPQAPTTSALDLGAEKTFTFKSVDADGNKLPPSYVGNALVQAVWDTTGYKRRFEQYSSNNIFDVKGVEVVQLPNAIRVSYVNGERYRDTGRTHLTRSSATFAYTIEEDAGALRVKVLPPKEVVTVKESSPLFVTYNTLASDEALAADVKKIYDRMSPAILIDKWVTGEVNASYGVDAIQANFKRKCRVSAVTGPGALTCMVGNQSVSVSVVPYQSGSKASYKFMVQYRLDSNGGTTFSADSTKELVASIEKIVKD